MEDIGLGKDERGDDTRLMGEESVREEWSYDE